MIYSMTGFGKAERVSGGTTIAVEIRSLNNRFLDLTFRAPRIFLQKENAVKDALKKRIERGKITLNIVVQSGDYTLANYRIDPEVVQQYTAMLRDAAEKAGINEPIRLDHLLHFEDIFTSLNGAEEHETLWSEITAVIDAAVDELNAMRKLEGQALANDLLERLSNIDKHIDTIENLSSSAVQEEFEKLTERITKLLARTDIEPQRLEAELAILADKVDITEEIVRFRSHNAMFRDLTGGPSTQIGRKLNFLTQEMGREANTMGSKSSQPSVIHTVVAIKEELEKLREQIQNVE